MGGLDISFSKPSQKWWEDRRAEGFEVMVQNLWTGGFASNEGIKAVASNNLRRARLAGYKVAAYVNASPPDWWPLKIQMDNIKANAGAEWANIGDVVIDVEIPRITMARVIELADALEGAGKIADVLYSAYWFWSGHMGNDKDPRWLRFKLWNADYDGDPTIDFPRPYGPWTEVEHKQYKGTTYIEGQAIDLNTFNDLWLSEVQPPIPKEPIPVPPIEEDLMGKILDLATAFGKAIEAEVAKAMKVPIPIKGDTGATGPAGPPGPGGGGAAQRTYTVKAGDSLGTIANKYSGVTWQQIYEANKALIGSDPDLIHPGQVLVIP